MRRLQSVWADVMPRQNGSKYPVAGEWEHGAGIFAECKFFAPCQTGASGVTMTLCNGRNLVRDVPRAGLIDSRPNSLFLRHGFPAVPRKIPCSGKQGIRRLNLRNCMVIGRVHLHSWADPAQIPCRKAESSSAETAHIANIFSNSRLIMSSCRCAWNVPDMSWACARSSSDFVSRDH